MDISPTIKTTTHPSLNFVDRRDGQSCGVNPISWFRIHLTYLWRHRRLLNLAAPTLFTELVQHRKLHDRDPRLPVLADKVLVKDFVTDRLGPRWVIPTYWTGQSLPLTPQWLVPFVVKSRHGCNQRIFVRNASEIEDWDGNRRRASRWMDRAYGEWLDEWLYRDIERGILVEPFIGVSGALPIDYKFYVFHGRVEFIQVHIDREYAHRWIIFDRHWARVSAPTPDHCSPPASLSAMIEAAEELARGIDFVRIDLYEIDGTPLFGEMTFYPGSGLDPFDSVNLDTLMGVCWLENTIYT